MAVQKTRKDVPSPSMNNEFIEFCQRNMEAYSEPLIDSWFGWTAMISSCGVCHS